MSSRNYLWHFQPKGAAPPFTPPEILLSLANFDQGLYEYDFLAVLMRTASGNVLYADADRGGTDAPLEGSLEVGSIPDGSGANISRIQWTGGDVVINDNDSPNSLSLSGYFGTGDPGRGMTLFLQTTPAGPAVSDTIDDLFNSAGGGFLRLRGFSTPFSTALNGISVGDRYILGMGRIP